MRLLYRTLYRLLTLFFLDPKMDLIEDPHQFPVPRDGTMTIIFDDHRFCAGKLLDVRVMDAPHRHSQFEINHVTEGAMTYWFDGWEIRLSAGQTAVFWGMVPHRTIGHEDATRFVCLYVPVSLFMAIPLSDRFRTALFGGAFAAGRRIYSTDAESFRRWREDLLEDDGRLESIVREELGARLRRFDHDAWSNLRDTAAHRALRTAGGRLRYDLVERMIQFIGENYMDDLLVADVAAAAGLHPNYAMTLFKRSLSVTILEYVTRCRLDTAQAKLAATDDAIAEVAFSSGFRSLSRFYEAFHARFAMSPARFRRWQRQGILALSQVSGELREATADGAPTGVRSPQPRP